jgi:D-alanyl-D-alanine carboxypeptidase/D-alanyl-D-alanine-endopeptidase (penicillin-binding protein 4)
MNHRPASTSFRKEPYRMRRLFVLPLLLVTAVPAFASVESELERLIASRNLRQTRVAVAVRDLSADRTLAHINADRRMIPASNMKLLTTAAALGILGTDHKFRTELRKIPASEPDQPPRLLLKGSGDPALGDPVLLERYGYSVDQLLGQWVQAVQKTQRQTFSTLLIDDRIFDRQFVHPTWPENQLIRHYCAQVAGLNFHENVLHVMPRPAREDGQTPRIQLYPEVPFMEVANRATTGGEGVFQMDRRLGSNKLIFSGSLTQKPRQPHKLTFHDPAMVLGRILTHQLEEAGITVESVTRPEDQAQLPEGNLLAVATTSLELVLQRANRQSENMFAEALMKRSGRAMTGRPGSWENGSAAVRSFLQRQLGTEAASVAIADGSGMSRDNRLTPKVIVRLLGAMHDKKQLAPVYRQSLARPGQEGTLDDRLKQVPGRVYAKSGYLNGVSALSGYIQVATDAGNEKTLAFSFLFNGFSPPLHNHDMKKLQDQMVELIAATYAEPARIGG